LEKVKSELPEMPWDTVKRLTEHYGVAGRDIETLLGLDEFDGQGVEYFENVTGAKQNLASEPSTGTCNSNALALMIRIAHEVLGQLGKVEMTWTPEIIPSKLMNEITKALEEDTINGKLSRSA
jgi:aspartyl-tRNA(Asn)/glutamyl-tRNA(Gln) amidotransferase subunit B